MTDDYVLKTNPHHMSTGVDVQLFRDVEQVHMDFNISIDHVAMSPEAASEMGQKLIHLAAMIQADSEGRH